MAGKRSERALVLCLYHVVVAELSGSINDYARQGSHQVLGQSKSLSGLWLKTQANRDTLSLLFILFKSNSHPSYFLAQDGIDPETTPA